MSSAVVQVQPDSKGNITITIKLVIAGAQEQIASTTNVNETSGITGSPLTAASQILLNESSDESTVLDEDGDKNKNTNKAPYSLRSRVQVEDDDEDEDDEEYEVDYELSQQVSSLGF